MGLIRGWATAASPDKVKLPTPLLGGKASHVKMEGPEMPVGRVSWYLDNAVHLDFRLSLSLPNRTQQSTYETMPPSYPG